MKQKKTEELERYALSPPARGRGLKQRQHIGNDLGSRSPPARGRGLKPLLWRGQQTKKEVAPRAGAWIETCTVLYASQRFGSPPARGRGLKHT